MPVPKDTKCKAVGAKYVCEKAGRGRMAAAKPMAAKPKRAAAPKRKAGCDGEKRMMAEGEPRITIPKMRSDGSGRMFHETIHLGGVPISSGSPYDGRKAVPVRPVGSKQAPEMQSGSNPLMIRTSGMESGT